jgi:hypothetical protein
LYLLIYILYFRIRFNNTYITQRTDFQLLKWHYINYHGLHFRAFEVEIQLVHCQSKYMFFPPLVRRSNKINMKGVNRWTGFELSRQLTDHVSNENKLDWWITYLLIEPKVKTCSLRIVTSSFRAHAFMFSRQRIQKTLSAWQRAINIWWCHSCVIHLAVDNTT